MSRTRFPKAIVAAIDAGMILGVRAGDEHRFIGIWAVVADGRVFVRSWGLTRRGWHQALVDDARGAIQVGDRELLCRAVPARGERTKEAVDRAYREKYHTKASLKWVRGFERGRRRDGTLELVPRSSR